MSTWVLITHDTILSGLSAKQQKDFSTTATGSSVPDRLTPLIANFSNEIRTYVQTHSPDAVSATPLTIPPEFVDRAVDYIRYKLLTGVEGYDPGNARTKTYEKAEAFFMKVAEGKILPSKADDAITVTIAAPINQAVPMISGGRQSYGRNQQDGI